MKRLSTLLLWLTAPLLALIVYLLVDLSIDLYKVSIGSLPDRNTIFNIILTNSEFPVFQIVVYILIFGCLLYLLYLVFIFIKTTLTLKKNLVFNSKNGRQIYIVGKGLVIVGIALSFLQIATLFVSKINEVAPNQSEHGIFYRHGYNFGFAVANAINGKLLIFIVALFILIIAKLISEGSLIKQENDLTI